MKTYGFIKPKIDATHYLAGSLPKVILQNDGQWDAYLPVYEPQFNSTYDTTGCTVFGTQNGIEILVKKLTGTEDNYSERFTYILAGITPPGGDPHTVAETIRANGLINEVELPMTDDFIEYLKPKPMTRKYLDLGKAWLDRIDFKHEWVISKPTKKEDRTSLIKENLKYSPVCVSVTAWNREGDIYVDRGQRNCHWCVAYGWTDLGWKIFDSYDQSTKIYSFDSNIEFAKRFSLTLKEKGEAKISILKQILDKLLEWANLLKQPVVAVPAPQPQPEPPVVLPDPPKYDWDTPILARHSVRVICDEEGLTTEQKNTLCATIGGESGWKTDVIHPNYIYRGGKREVASTDYGIAQWNDYYHQNEITPDEALHDPEKAVRLMCAYWKRGQRNLWVCYSSGLYKKYL